jgi:crossover junction endodeoxyribonuclease RuvC
MIILGIDPGYAIIGWGVLKYEHSRFSVLGYGAITTDAGTPFPERLQTIYNDMCYIFEKYKPEVMSMEKLFYNSNQKTVIDVAQARGVITLAAQMYGKDIFEYTPLQVKQSVTGYGRAEKKQVMEMTRSILGLKSVPKPDDTADALAMAICHAHVSGSSIGKLNDMVKKAQLESKLGDNE